MKEKMLKSLRMPSVVVGSLMIAMCTNLRLGIMPKLHPDAVDFWGYLYQLLGRITRSFMDDRFGMTALFIGSLWLLNRYLFHKPRNTGMGEYLLCALFALFRLGSEAMRAADTIAVLWADLFQILKSGLVFVSSMLLMLCLLRALNEWISKPQKGRKLWFDTLWKRFPFWFSFGVLLLFWLPHIIIKYPGVIDVDTGSMILDGIQRGGSDHFPPFDTWLFSTLCLAGRAIGRKNLFYCLFTLFQCLLYITAFSYTLWLMDRKKMPTWLLKATLALYAFSPVFVGWGMILGKDSLFFPFAMLLGVLLLHCVCDLEAFCARWYRVLAIPLCAMVMILVRPNGVFIALPAAAVLLGVMLYRKIRLSKVALLAVGIAAAVGASSAITDILMEEYNLVSLPKKDAFSVVFQPTAVTVLRHGEELPQKEKQAIDGVLEYDKIREYYLDNCARVNHTMRTELAPEAFGAYLQTWLRQFVRYPVDYVDAVLGIASPLLDLKQVDNVYYSVTNPALTEGYIYPASQADMQFYDAQRMETLDSAQRFLSEWYHRSTDFPVLGEMMGISFHFHLMLMMMYLCWVNGRKGALVCYVPALITGLFGFVSPIVTLRLMLPMLGALPLWFAGYEAAKPEEKMEC